MTVNYEKIENYVHNGLTEAERTAFEAEMATDTELAEIVHLYRDIEVKMQGSVAATAGEAALRQQLEALGQQYFGKKGGATVMELRPEGHSGLDTGKAAATAVEAPVVPMHKRRILYYVASAAAVLLVFLLIRPFGGGKFDADKVYAQNADYNIPAWGSSRGDNKEGDTLKWQVANLLENKKYPEALPLLEKITTTDGNDITAALAKGACYTQTDDSARAMQVYLAVETKASGTLKDQATFYKALLYIKYKDIEGCRKALETISGDTWKETATKLLKALPKQ
jgi:hypothetical protein